MKVNIVVRTRNRTQFLERALASVLSQTYNQWHCVVVNDGGDIDSVNSVIDRSVPEALHNAFTVLHNAESRGMEAASNQGLRNHSADYYVIHDDDDSWAPDFLDRCVGALESQKDSSVQGVVARTIKVMEVVEEDRIAVRKTSVFMPEVTFFTIPRVVQNNPFMPIAFMYTRKALDLLEGYDETLPVVGDWEFNLRFIRRFDIAYVPDTTAYYHVRMESRGDSSDNSISKALAHQHYRSLIINRYIRQAMDEGSLTLGHMLAAAEPGLHSNRLGEKLNHLYPKLKKLHPRSLLARMRGGK